MTFEEPLGVIQFHPTPDDTPGLINIMNIFNPQAFSFEGLEKPFDNPVGLGFIHKRRRVLEAQELQFRFKITRHILRTPVMADRNALTQAFANGPANFT